MSSYLIAKKSIKRIIPLDLAFFWLSVIGVSFYIFSSQTIESPPVITQAATGSVIANATERQEMKSLSTSLDLNSQSRDFVVSVADDAIKNGGIWSEVSGKFADEGRTAIHTAWAYQITGKGEYAQATINLLSSQTNFTPDIKSVPIADRPNRELSWGVQYTLLAQAFNLVEDYSGFDSAKKETIRTFFHNLAYDILSNTPNLNDNCITNMKWFRASLVASAGVVTNDSNLKDVAFNAYKRYLESATGHCWPSNPRVIEANGFIGHEMARFESNGDDTWYYTGFSLSGMVVLAEIARQQGVNLWDYTTSDGRNLKLAFDSLVKYFTGTAWPHVGGKGVSYPFIHTDYAATYQAAYAYWGNSEYLKIIEQNRDWSGTKRPTAHSVLFGPFVYLYNGRHLAKPGDPTPTRVPTTTPTPKPSITPTLTPGQTNVLYERWDTIQTQPNALISDLSKDERFPNSPTSTTYISSLNAPLHQGASTIDSNFGSRMRAILIPQKTGSYTFYLTADDAAVLYLGTSAEPDSKQLIAHIDRWLNYQDYSCSISEAQSCSVSQIQSNPIQLINGNSYYLEVLHVESIGEDHTTVFWKSSDSTTPVVIDSNNLRKFTQSVTPTQTPIHSSDINQDGVTNIFDLGILASFYGTSPTAQSPLHERRSDINQDGSVNVFDLSLLIASYQRTS
ncbi:hypothetical protein HGA91_00315 [candidate division WWE3 bacterium]|nr:hypothetical protein [candidate division WWE3 bacterium]